MTLDTFKFLVLNSSMLITFADPLILGLLFAAQCYGVFSGLARWSVWILFGATIVDMVVPMAKFPAFSPRWARMCCLAPGMRDYFPSKLVMPGLESFKKDKNYMFCVHPHGLWMMGSQLIYEALVEAGYRPITLGASILGYLPFVKRHLRAHGFAPADKKTTIKAMNQAYPHNITFNTTGGIAEMFYGGIGGTGPEQIILRKRKGFCKLALQEGFSLVPVYMLGANQHYVRHIAADSLISRISTKIGVSLVFWTGWGNIPYSPIPCRHPLVVAVGTPIDVEKVENPSQAQVEKLHDEFVTAMKALFDQNKVDPLLPQDGDFAWCSKTLLLEDESSSGKKHE